MTKYNDNQKLDGTTWWNDTEILDAMQVLQQRVVHASLKVAADAIADRLDEDGELIAEMQEIIMGAGYSEKSAKSISEHFLKTLAIDDTLRINKVNINVNVASEE
jgi:hypothetical protein